MEILESLYNLKDIGKHLTDSVCQGKSQKGNNNDNKLANDLYEINEFLMNERSSAIDATDNYQKIDDLDDQDSLKDGDFEENLHVSVEHDDIQIPISQLNDTTDFYDMFGPEVSAREYMISPVTSITMIQPKANEDNYEQKVRNNQC